MLMLVNKITSKIESMIPIFFSFDNNYVVPAAVAFYSLLNKAKNGIYYKMYVLHSDITEENQNLLQNIINRKQNAYLTFIDTQGFLKDEWDNGTFSKGQFSKQFTFDTIIRCFAARFFPQYEKIIYSDVDVVFMDDISELYNVDLDSKYIAAVKGPFMKYSEYELSHLSKEYHEKFKDSYFGGGIWVMNLSKIREDNLEKRMIEIIKDDTIIKRWNDQDIMNIACDNKVEFIPLNYISYPYLHDLLINPNFTSHYTREELYNSIINPKIIHYAQTKPWNGNPKNSEIWWTIFDYLELPKTKIFDESERKSIDNIKHRKYKKLFNIFLIISIVLIVTNVILILSFYK